MQITSGPEPERVAPKVMDFFTTMFEIIFFGYSPSPNSRGLIKKRGLAIFPDGINGEGVNKWKWVDFLMQCLNRGVVNSWEGNIDFF